ncbi:hypothetical protein B7P33_06765 [Sediminicola luteus]|uniref:Threonine synthase n=2 Tax=Sediminicola luteus TaxID=319238 RepID=A0A2A4GAR9_9FLAO|nr:hypothetical protein B7P33_06765 [Sediminicola luteus]
MRILYLGLFLVLGMACTEKKKVKEEPQPSKQVVETEEKRGVPEDLKKVLEAHGGQKAWKAKRTLHFEIPKEKGVERHTVDLWDRRDHVATDTYSMGFDGEAVWVHDPEKQYKGNAEVYHNLMFYFYAMPFVLADPGIQYEVDAPLVVDGVSYPGFRIRFNDGVGASSKDEYFLHYDPKSYRMAWLGYTFTFGSDERSEKVNWIHYAEWNPVNDILLPKSIAWHKYEGRDIKEIRSTVVFENARLSAQKEDALYTKPVAN